MLQNAYFLAKIGADTAENEQHFAEILPKTGNYPTGPPAAPARPRGDGRFVPACVEADCPCNGLFAAKLLFFRCENICFAAKERFFAAKKIQRRSRLPCGSSNRLLELFSMIEVS